MYYQFVAKSSNAKTGPIPVTNSSRDTCPDFCSLKDNGCYAGANFHTRINWDKVTSGERGGSWSDLCDNISDLPENQIWRHNVSGDLPHYNQGIDMWKLTDLIYANKGKRGFTYTHHDMSDEYNQAAVKIAIREGFTINLSADNPDMADELMELGIAPVVTVVPEDQLSNFKTPKGHKVVICPAVVRDNITCKTCKACAIADRDIIIGFPAHGSQRRRIKFDGKDNRSKSPL